MSDPFLDHKEPEEIFLPLDSERYADFYAMEMDNFVRDIHFYRQHCGEGSRILELGCGSGRISRALAASGHSVVGLDISLAMLRKAALHRDSTLSWVCMDMTAMAFCRKFNHVLIPYNSLNLLRDREAIAKCLRQTHGLLEADGSLLLQLYIPDQQLRRLSGQKIFQFQIFPLPGNRGKLIKETLRSYHPGKGEILLEERYRVRPVQGHGVREDLSHLLHLAGFPLEQWLELLKTNGFHRISLYGDYDSRPFQDKSDSLLFIQASPSLHLQNSIKNIKDNKSPVL